MVTGRGETPSGRLIEEVRLICVNVAGNNNKFIVAQLYDSGDFWRCWGKVRADEKGDLIKHASNSKLEPGAGRHSFDKLVREKTNPGNADDKRYTKVDAVDAPTGSTSSVSAPKSELKRVATEQIKHDCPITKKLIEYLSEVNVHQILSGTTMNFNKSTGMFSTPLGIVTPDSVRTARKLLDNLADYVVNRDWSSSSMFRTVNDYLRLIPHDVGHKFDVRALFPDVSSVQKENDILDALDASYVQLTTGPKPTAGTVATNTPSVFNVKMEMVNDDKVRQEIINSFMNSRNRQHAVYGYKVKDIFEVDIETVRNAFENRGRKVGNIMKLWHGAPACHLLSIFRGGLRLPPRSSPHVTGALFSDRAPGIYASDQSTKALQYAARCAPGQSGGTNLRRFFMFMVKFAMGKIFYPKDMNGGFPRPGYDSTFAKGGECGYLQNNEMIVYSADQVNLDYLLEFSPG
jgi:poly [ADP-ribose] polymerase